MAFGQIDRQKFAHAVGQIFVERGKPFHHVVMYGRLAHAENFSRLSHGGAEAHDIFSFFQNPCVDIVIQKRILRTIYLYVFARRFMPEYRRDRSPEYFDIAGYFLEKRLPKPREYVIIFTRYNIIK